MLYRRVLQIDDLTRPDHSYIRPEDVCYYLGEYTARGGFEASDTNQLISNLKKPMARRANRREWRYKTNAIMTVADDLRAILGKASIENLTFVPVPPSKAKHDPGYDPRLMQILTRMGTGFEVDARELVLQSESMPASHESERRPEIEELVGAYKTDEDSAAIAPRPVVVVFDDLLTTGRHFRAMSTVLSRRFPTVEIIGLFVARRAPKTDDVLSLF